MGFDLGQEQKLIAAGLTIVGGTLLYRYVRSLLTVPAKSTYRVPSKGDPADAIVLVDFPKMSGLASSPSPFVCKVETFLRFHNIPYTKRVGDLSSAPLKKLPYIEHGKVKVPDSAFIIRYLANTYPEKVPKLSAEEEAMSRAVTALLEAYFGMYLGLARWLEKEGYDGMCRLFAPSLPPVLKTIVPALLRVKIHRVLTTLGVTSFCEEDQLVMLEADAAALSTLLGKKRYLTGDAPTPADASMFGFFDNCLNDGVTPIMGDILRKHPNLVDFTERIRITFYPELAEA